MSYTDQQDQPLFCVLRLVSRTDPSEKTIRPLNYGYWKDTVDQRPRWSLRAHSGDQRLLYSLPLLNKHPNARILIVEGKKDSGCSVEDV